MEMRWKERARVAKRVGLSDKLGWLKKEKIRRVDKLRRIKKEKERRQTASYASLRSQICGHGSSWPACLPHRITSGR